MDEEKIEYFRTNPSDGVRFEIVSKKGSRKYFGHQFRKHEDKKFLIRLSKNGVVLDFQYSYPDQYRLMELVMNNIILDNVFEKEHNTFIELMKKIKENRKKEKKLDDFKNENT